MRRSSRVISVFALLLTCTLLDPLTLPAQSLMPAKGRPPVLEKRYFPVAESQGFRGSLILNTELAMGRYALRDPQSGLGFEFPPGSKVEHLYIGGTMFGCIVNGSRHVEMAYRPDLILPGPRRQDYLATRPSFWKTAAGPQRFDPFGWSGYYYNRGIPTNVRGCDDDGDGKIDEDDLDGIDNDGDWNPLTDDVGADGLPDSLEVSCDGMKYDAVTNPDPGQDDYDPAVRDKCHPDPATGVFPLKNDVAVWTERNGIPDHGEPHVDEDYGAVSDNDLYAAVVDTGSAAGDAWRPVGLKVIQKSFAWDDLDEELILPFEYSFINIGTDTLAHVWVGIFLDPDVGPADAASYMTHNQYCLWDSLRTYYVFNPQDRGSTPLGLTILRTPISIGDGGRASFHVGYPSLDDSLTYGFMTGGLASPDPFRYACDPTNLSDVSFYAAFGEVQTMKPGDTARFAFALESAMTLDEGRGSLREAARRALGLYDRRFHAPVVPPSPNMKLTQGAHAVTIEWGPAVGGVDPVQTWDAFSKIAQAEPDTSWRRTNPPCGTGGACVDDLCTIVDGKPYRPGGRVFLGYALYRSEYEGAGLPPNRTFTLLQQYIPPGSKYNPGYPIPWAESYTDSLVRPGKTYWYAVTSLGLPDLPYLTPVVTPFGTRFDTLDPVVAFSLRTESRIADNAAGLNVKYLASTRRNVMVVPNPYRGDADYTTATGGYEGSPVTWDGTQRLIKFINLPRTCTIRIFSLAGDLITTLSYQAPPSNPDQGEMTYNLFSESGRPLASGVYVYSVESSLGTQIGKFVVIR